MPRLSQIIVRSALIWLAIGYTMGGLLLSHKGVPWFAGLWALRGVHVHVLMVGWTVQLAYGVAFWILPRLDADGSRGDERPVWLCYVLLNGGVLAALLHGLLQMFIGTAPLWLDALAGVCYAGSALAFARHAWPRILPFGAAARQEER